MSSGRTPIPANIITGFLGVGKTTAITHLLNAKPAKERWAVLVNEFGEVGIDGSLFAGANSPAQGVFIKEVPGGCMCCTAGLSMQMALGMLLATANPHRLLIEPTGLGHPKEVIETLTADHYKETISLQKTIALVDARSFDLARHTEHASFNEQLDVADVVVANKSDCFAEEDFARLLEYMGARYGANVKPIYPVSYGQLHLGWLEGEAAMVSPATTRKLHQNAFPVSETLTSREQVAFPEKGYITVANEGEGYVTRGWIFNPDYIFDRQKIFALMTGVEAERAKGVFITHQGVIGYNKVNEVVTEIVLEDSADSRVELIAEDQANIVNGFEDALLACT